MEQELKEILLSMQSELKAMKEAQEQTNSRLDKVDARLDKVDARLDAIGASAIMPLSSRSMTRPSP